MKLQIGSIVIRCHEFDKMMAFWQDALHYVPRYPPESGWVILRDPEGRGPIISLDRVPERRIRLEEPVASTWVGGIDPRPTTSNAERGLPVSLCFRCLLS